jgi:hypothetical protein
MLIIIGIIFVILGLFLIIFGTVFFREAAVATFLALFFYVFTWILTVSASSFLAGIVMTLLIGGTFGFIIYFLYDKVEKVSASILFGVLFAVIALIISQVIWASTKWSFYTGLFFLLILSIAFFIGLSLGWFVFEHNSSDVIAKWNRRHWLTSVLGGYFFVRGIILIYANTHGRN